jgi:hypothetical protein
VLISMVFDKLDFDFDAFELDCFWFHIVGLFGW